MPPKEVPALTKEALELQKLQIDIEQLRRRWWTKPAYLGVFLPIALAVLAFLGAQLSGVFDRSRSKLEADVEILTEQKERFENRIVAIRDAHDRLQSASDSLVETRSIRGSSKNPQQAQAFKEFNEAYTELITIINEDLEEPR